MKLLLLLVFSFLGAISQAEPAPQGEGLYNGLTLEQMSIDNVIHNIPKGAIVFLGEQHNYGPIQKGQLAILNALRSQGHKVHVAMEFVDYTQQEALDQYRSGSLHEEDFLKKIGWGSPLNFNFYRDQILFPKSEWGEKTFGINSPRWITGQISKEGLANLSEDAKKLLPPQMQLGRESYKKRFTEMMAGHVTPEKMQRYFEAQSVWDDTMAWKLTELPVPTEDTIVVVVGQFHVEYGGGLPYQYQTRSKIRPVVTIEEFLYYDDEQIPFKNLIPSIEYGAMADYIYIVKEKN